MAGTAIIGLGNMGQGMARNILKSGIALTGFDLSETARSGLAKAGGKAAASAAEAAQGCDLLLVMVQTPAQAHDVLFGAGGAAAALDPGSTVILCSTVAPSDARALGAALEEAGHMMLDAPVSGGQKGADAGQLTVMASGPDAAFARAEAVLAAVANTVHRLGDAPGMGATYKVVHQLAAGVHIAAAAELLALGAKAGCDPQKLFEIVTTSAGQSWMLEDRGPRMMQADPDCTSSVDIFVKDVGLVLQTGRENGVPLPLTAIAHQMFLAASAMGHGAGDDSLVIRAYEKLTGKPVHES
ncbi:L-threonate dehydrogenase [Roseovarius sp. CAU 1744]|uniref:L-threonate dehydrogenase n=1 Tax=Roseovarius sp. CAU 1744 TaxID=3140368 RepID=UPI00325B0A28